MSDSATASSTITFPEQRSSLDTVRDWANRFDFVTLNVVEDDARAGTFEVSSPGEPGKTITITSAGQSFTITYYVAKDHNINLVTTSIDKGVNIIATFDEGYFDGWDYSVPESLSSYINVNRNDKDKNTSTLTVTLADGYEGEEDFTIYASLTNGKTASATVTVNGSSISAYVN